MIETLKTIASFFLAMVLPLLSVSLAVGQEQPHQRTIRLEGRKKITVSTAMVRLADLVEASSQSVSDDDTIIALKKIEIEASPAPGSETTIPAIKVLERLKEQGVNLNEIIYVFPRVFTVQRASRPLTVSELRAAIETYLAQSDRDVQIKSIDYPQEVQVVPATNEIEVTPYNSVRPNELGFTVLARAPGETDVRFTVKAQIDEWLEIPVARRGMGRGNQVTPNDVVMARLNLAAIPSDAAREEGDVVGLATSAEISPGEVFRRSKLIVPPVIESGGKVTMVYKKGAFEATASGTALEAGIIGEEIRVKNDNSRRIVAGKVLAPGMVGVN